MHFLTIAILIKFYKKWRYNCTKYQNKIHTSRKSNAQSRHRRTHKHTLYVPHTTHNHLCTIHNTTHLSLRNTTTYKLKKRIEKKTQTSSAFTERFPSTDAPRLAHTQLGYISVSLAPILAWTAPEKEIQVWLMYTTLMERKLSAKKGWFVIL